MNRWEYKQKERNCTSCIYAFTVMCTKMLYKLYESGVLRPVEHLGHKPNSNLRSAASHSRLYGPQTNTGPFYQGR